MIVAAGRIWTCGKKQFPFLVNQPSSGVYMVLRPVWSVDEFQFHLSIGTVITCLALQHLNISQFIRTSSNSCRFPTSRLSTSCQKWFWATPTSASFGILYTGVTHWVPPGFPDNAAPALDHRTAPGQPGLKHPQVCCDQQWASRSSLGVRPHWTPQQQLFVRFQRIIRISTPNAKQLLHAHGVRWYSWRTNTPEKCQKPFQASVWLNETDEENYKRNSEQLPYRLLACPVLSSVPC